MGLRTLFQAAVATVVALTVLAVPGAAPASAASATSSMAANPTAQRPVGSFEHPFAARFTARAAQLAAANTGSSASTAPLQSGGGSVMTLPSVYLDYWGPEWQTGFSTGGYTSDQAQAYINAFFSEVGGSFWLNSTVAYCQAVAQGSNFCPSNAQFVTNPQGQLKGTWNDAAVAVPAPPTGTNIKAEVKRAVQHFGLDPHGVYFVLTPSGKSESGFKTSWCGWHGFDTAVTSAPYAYIPYQPDAGGSCGMNFINRSDDSFGHGYFDGFSVVAGHEYGESVTDPYPSSGWADSSGSENGDKCAWSHQSGNTTFASNYFAVQPLWNNIDGGCSMGDINNVTRVGGLLSSAADAAGGAGSNRLDVVYQGVDSAVWHAWSTDGGASYVGESLGGYATSKPSIVSWGPNRLDVVVRGGDGAAWHRYWDGATWHPWESVGGRLIGAPDEAAWSANRLDIVVRGTDNHAWHKCWDGRSWHNWENLGGIMTADPTSVSHDLNQYEIFVRGTDNQLWHRWWYGSAWSGWDTLGGNLAGGPSATTWGNGRMDVFALGSDNHAWHRSFTGFWNGWTSLNGVWTSDPGAAALSPGTIDVFERGQDGALWQISLQNQ